MSKKRALKGKSKPNKSKRGKRIYGNELGKCRRNSNVPIDKALASRDARKKSY